MNGMTSQRMYSSNIRCIQLRWNGCAPVLYQLASLFDPTVKNLTRPASTYGASAGMRPMFSSSHSAPPLVGKARTGKP
jgi:hypothetical protein